MRADEGKLFDENGNMIRPEYSGCHLAVIAAAVLACLLAWILG